jgi:heme oxygenase (biliverdin-IX-beta and delta-forming)
MGTLHSQSKEETSRLNFAHYGGTFSGSIRHLLRSETATDHANVDARFSALIDLGTAGYGEFLRLSAAAICPLEQALLEGKVECILPDWEERSRRAALRADLADFGIADPTLAQRPSLGEEAHQFGVLYVLEGSRLGARVLARRLLASANLPAPCAVRYLRHGEGRPLWQTFLERLESSAAVRRSPTDAIAGARTAFAWFGVNGTARPARTATEIGI